VVLQTLLNVCDWGCSFPVSEVNNPVSQLLSQFIFNSLHHCRSREPEYLGSVFKDGFNTSDNRTMNEHIITDKLIRKDAERITHGINWRTILGSVWANWKPIKKVSQAPPSEDGWTLNYVQKDKQGNWHVTLWCIHATIVAMETYGLEIVVLHTTNNIKMSCHENYDAFPLYCWAICHCQCETVDCCRGN